MDSLWIEMVLFLHLSFDSIPHNIPSITAANIKKYLPKRFNEKDVGLQQVENDLDTEALGLGELGLAP